ADRVVSFFRESLERIGQLPEVVSASAVSHIPATGGWSTEKFLIEGRPERAPGELQVTNFLVAAPNYLRTMRIPVIKGREFTEDDTEDSPRVAIVSCEFVRRYFPDAEPLGQHLRIGGPAAEPATIVGGAGKVKGVLFCRRPRACRFVSHSHPPGRFLGL